MGTATETRTSFRVVPLADIRPGNQYRRDMGDLDALAAKMRDLGQLHPIGLSSSLTLVFGSRRLAAARLLGWTEIQAQIFPSFDDELTALKAEQAENDGKEFTLSEKTAIAAAIEERERQEAKKRQATTGTAPGKGKNASGTSSRSVVDQGNARDKVGQAIGVSGKTYEAAKKVIGGGVPELATMMDRGDVSVKDAALVAALPKKEQAKLIAAGAKEVKAKAKKIREAAKVERERNKVARGSAVGPTIADAKPQDNQAATTAPTATIPSSSCAEQSHDQGGEVTTPQDAKDQPDESASPATEESSPDRIVITAEHEQEAKAKQEAAILKDGVGNRLPDRLKDTFFDKELSETIAEITAALDILDFRYQMIDKSLSRKPHKFIKFSAVLDGLRGMVNPKTAGSLPNILKLLEDNVPYRVCPVCQGKQCAECRHGGLIPRWKSDELDRNALLTEG